MGTPISVPSAPRDEIHRFRTEQGIYFDAMAEVGAQPGQFPWARDLARLSAEHRETLERLHHDQHLLQELSVELSTLLREEYVVLMALGKSAAQPACCEGTQPTR